MKKLFFLAAVCLMTISAAAQGRRNLDTYIGANLATEDLNGTARYVGMGGALDALGADLSTMGSNPAGIGMYRKNQVTVSFGLNSQQDGKAFHDALKTNASFDQIGIVLSTRVSPTSYFNFGFNFHKSRNFDYVLSAADVAINGSSLQRQTYVKLMRGDLDLVNPSDPMCSLVHPYRETQVDQLSYCINNQYDNYDETGKYVGDSQGPYLGSFSPDGLDYTFDRAHTGYIGEYDFNLSGNINNRVYLGLTVGIHDVHYNGYSEYFERYEPFDVISDNAPTPGTVLRTISQAKYTDKQRITGTGYDLKLGVIVRPMEESPFRFGLHIHTPTWYKLKATNYTAIHDGLGEVAHIDDNKEFRMNTPWKFGLSAGTTIGREWALGFGYEYTDYGSVDMRSITNRYYDAWGDAYRTDSESDAVMKRLTEKTLKGVHTLKLGAEFRPDDLLSLRLGYNYVSAMYQKDGVRDQTIDAPGNYMASTSDYTNWEDTHRLTAGVGFTFDAFRLDLAYQFQATNGKFYPYMSSLTGSNVYTSGVPFTVTNECHGVKVSNKRHQVLCTLGYTF